MASTTRLLRPFFARPAVELAPDLVGTRLVHEIVLVEGGPRLRRIGRIVEVEAYVGPEDLACHASKGRTARTEVMFGPAGHAYVFVIYGVYPCFNIVADRPGHPAAVLVRAIEPVADVERSGSGPGRVCLAMGIDLGHYGVDLTRRTAGLWLEPPDRPVGEIIASPRVNVDYAGEWARRPWRFSEAHNRHVSTPRPFRLPPPSRGRRRR